MDRNSIETLCCTIMRHAKKDGLVRLSRLMEYYGATHLAADVGLGDCLYAGFVPCDMMCVYLFCAFRIAGHALARHGLVTEIVEVDDAVFELTLRGAEVARRGSRALRIDWLSHGFRVGGEHITVTVTAAPGGEDFDHDGD
jgi:hypothetical protein